ncbi:galactosyl transferase [Lophium mytilinum]|uniref:Galactosyl transferase n=1 Tax=Lophium mytilinum TaxID=390894 RepID=A0A6A6R8M2_9PEZI|nr:galactosyl transferase [Lophium mytilinum]
MPTPPSAGPDTTAPSREEAWSGEPGYFKNKKEWNFDAPLEPSDETFKPEEILILTASNGGGHNAAIPNLLERICEERDSYAKLHNYTHTWLNTDKYDVGDAHPVWAKIPAIADAFYQNPQAKWLWIADSDIIFMTHSVKLEEMLLSQKAMSEKIMKGQTLFNGMKDGKSHKTKITMPEEPKISNLDILITQDHNGINAGSIFIRRSQFTRFILEAWTDKLLMEDHWLGKEQDALKHLMLEHPLIRSHVGVFPQRMFNAYAVGGDKMGWREGDLMVHLAGCWVGGDHICKERFDEFWAKRKLE